MVDTEKNCRTVLFEAPGRKKRRSIQVKSVRRLLAVLLAGGVLLAGCSLPGKKDGAKSGAQSSAPSSSAASSKEEETFVFARGSWAGERFENQSLGVVFTLPAGWSAYTDEQIDAMMDSGADNLSDGQQQGYEQSKQQTIFDMVATAAEGLPAVQLAAEKMPVAALTEKNYLQILKKQLEAVAAPQYDTSADVFSLEVAQETFQVLPVTAEGVHQWYMVRQQGDYMVTIIATFAEGQEETMRQVLQQNFAAL